MDRIEKEQRSKNMAAIKSKNTKPELLIRHWIFAQGYRYRLNVSSIPGHPDLFFPKYKTAIFVHGCFWHRHAGCKYAYTPKSNMLFWLNKFDNNVKRDDEVKQLLQESNISCIVIWECTIKKMSKDSSFRKQILDIIEEMLKGSRLYLEL